MTLLKGVFAASMSILNQDLSLDVESTIKHAANIIKRGSKLAILGSTSQAQLISVKEKIKLIEKLADTSFKDQCLIGTGSNSLNENINIMNHSIKFGFNYFLLMNPAYYKNTDEGVYKFYANIIEKVPSCKIVLYNFHQLSGYTFTAEIVKKLVKDFPQNIVGMKDSTGNLFENLKINNFSMFVGSETKLLKGLRNGCAGCISATTNVTHSLAKKVYDDFVNNKEQTVNEKLCAVRIAFDETKNLISALHSFMSTVDEKYKYMLPPLTLLSAAQQKDLLDKLKKIEFINKKNIAA